MKGKGLIRICTVFLVIVSMLAMNIPVVFAAAYAPTVTVKVNPVGTADTVTVKGTTTSYVYAGDVVKVYRVASSSAAYTSGTLIGQAVATGSDKTAQAVVSIAQLGSTAGFVQIYVATNGADVRSTTAAKKYTAKAKIGKSDPFTKTVPASVYANNYANLDDLVAVNTSDTTKYPDGSIVKVYRSSASKVVMGMGELSGGKVSIEIPQLGTRAGSVYVSITKSVYYSESTRLAVTYSSEVSEALPAGAIAVTNNHDTAAPYTDSVTVTASKATPAKKALAVGDEIRIYRAATGSTLLADVFELEDTGNQTITLTSDLGVKASKLYVTRKSPGKKESARTAVSYKAENTSKALVPAQIKIPVNNRYGTADIIDVESTVASNVYLGAVLRFYEEIGGGSPVTSVTVTDATYTRITLPTTSTFIDANGGTFYASIERKNEIESNRVAVKYKGETPLTTAELTTIYELSAASDEFITNNPEGTNDQITVSNLSAGDVLRLYATDKTTDKDVIGEATSTGTSATITVAQLPQPATVTASVYLTITPVNSIESAKFGLAYTTDTAYTGITAVASNVSNANGSTMDTITVSGLEQYDTVSVYDASIDGNLLGSQIVGESNTSATVNLFFPSSSGTVYIAITKLGTEENKNRLSRTYTAEP